MIFKKSKSNFVIGKTMLIIKNTEGIQQIYQKFISPIYVDTVDKMRVCTL
jgi:hypothetical protein